MCVCVCACVLVAVGAVGVAAELVGVVVERFGVEGWNKEATVDKRTSSACTRCIILCCSVF